MLIKTNRIWTPFIFFVLLILTCSCNRPDEKLVRQENCQDDSVSPTKKQEIHLPNMGNGDFNHDLPLDRIFNSDWIKTKLEGNAALAFAKAVSAFLSNDKVDSTEKEISNFTVTFGEYKDLYIVLFTAKLAEGEREQLGGGTSLGRHALFFIKKDNLAISEPHLMK